MRQATHKNAAVLGCVWISSLLSTPATAQCIEVGRGQSVPGFDSGVEAMVAWDPDGPGPLTQRIVCVGSFRAAGRVPAAGIAMFDPANNQFTALASSIDGVIEDVVVLPTNELAVAGSFLRINGVLSAGVATFDGTNWSGLAGGLSGGGFGAALAVRPGGELVLGGSFSAVGGVAASNLAQWNGASWAPVLGGVDGVVEALTVRANGNLVVGGQFATAFGSVGQPTAVGRITELQGSSWATMAGGVTIPGNPALTSVNSIVETAGTLVVGGTFAQAGAVAAGNIAYFNGGWFVPGPFVGGPVARLRVTAPGTVAVCGRFALIGTGSFGGIATLSVGGGFTALGTGVGGGGNPGVEDALALGPTLFVAGDFSDAGGVSACDFASFTAGTWSAIGVGGGLRGSPAWSTLSEPQVTALGTLGANTIVGGRFTSAGGALLDSIAAWNGTTFAPLGPGLNGRVATMTNMRNGNLFVGGAFTAAGPVVATGAAQWNGNAWRDVAGGVNGVVETAITLRNGDLVVGGTFTSAGGVPAANVASFDGTSWRALGAGLPGTVAALAELPNGTIVAGGTFTLPGSGSNLAVFGGVWRSLGGGTNQPVRALLVRPDGRLVVGGQFTTAGTAAAGGLALWDGTALSQFGGTDGGVFALARTSSGNLIVGGAFGVVAGVRARNLAIFDGTNFAALGTGADGPVLALALTGAEQMAVGGDFATIDGRVSARFVELVTRCPANSTGIGAGCAGTSLTPQSLPQIGTTYRALAAGMPPLVIAAGAVGGSQVALSLQSIFPVATPGCTVFASPDILFPQVITGGAGEVGFAIPFDTTFVGQDWFYQVVALQLDTTGAIVGATSSDAFRLRVGAF